MVHYRIFEEVRAIDGTEYKAYGVAAFDSHGEIICAVHDITSVREKACTLAECCEKARLSPVHLLEAAEDYIVSDYY